MTASADPKAPHRVVKILTVAAPVHDAQAAFVGELRLGEKVRNRVVGFVAVEAVQVDVILDRPASAPQIT